MLASILLGAIVVVLASAWTTDSEHSIPSPTQLGTASMTVMQASMSTCAGDS